ncbi:nucleolar protein 14 homolog [Orussus abietinus]|uniref:nucleolar protein 14 homolog n=1 Tax=Orussus abietinus TaxID=222816 RepID=UPI0006254C72|nr:nucleolar protein 14 homolog [Orussus abietinus]
MAKLNGQKSSFVSSKGKDVAIKNPFELHMNKNKQGTLGRKNSTVMGAPGVARSRAANRRKHTLLQEYKIKNKDNIILDKRIGEVNSKMSEEDKVMARFAAERIKAYEKKSIFNLNDEEMLTHGGRTLAEIEKFEDPRSDNSDDENDTGKLNTSFVEEAHFGGGVLSKSSSMHRKDIIEQLIAESKKRKAERQKLRDQTIGLTEKLDSEWVDLLPIVSLSKKQPNSEESKENSAPDSYDIAMRQLKYDAFRPQNSDNSKTQDRNTLRSDESLNEGNELKIQDSESVNTHIELKSHEAKSNNYSKSADDLFDDFEIEEIEDEGSASDDSSQSSEDENSQDKSGIKRKLESQENTGSQKKLCLDDKTKNKAQQDVQITKMETTYPNDSLLCSNVKSFNKSIDNSELSSKIERESLSEARIKTAMPYTWEELQEMLQNDCPEQSSDVLDRIIASINRLLEEKNKKNLATLFEHLVQYLSNCFHIEEANNIVQSFETFNRLCPFIYDVAKINPKSAVNHLRKDIAHKYVTFTVKKKLYPPLETIILFKLIFLLFPIKTSKVRHSVITPGIMFMSDILLKGRVRSKMDISKGLFLSTLLLEYASLSKRYVPEAINFLSSIIYMAIPKEILKSKTLSLAFKRSCVTNDFLVIESDQSNAATDPETVKMTAKDLENAELTDEFKVKTLLTAVKLISDFKDQWKDIESVYYIFEQITKLLKINFMSKYPPLVRKNIKTIRKDLHALKNKKLTFLFREGKKPLPLRLYDPRTEPLYDGKRSKHSTSRKAERERLQRKYKKELKGATREIRRDTAFLSKVQIKEKLKEDMKRKEKVKEIFGDAAQQQAELKNLKRKK